MARQATASETIEQVVAPFKPSRRDRADSEKRKLLRDLIEAEGEAFRNAIIFCNRKSEVDVLAKSLKKYGLDAAPIHGDLDQSQRTRTLDAFRAGELKLLVASDVAARGLDIPAVSHIFNFDVPGHAEDYVHRIGRTGRAGREGKAITICGPRDDKALDAVEKLLEKTIRASTTRSDRGCGCRPTLRPRRRLNPTSPAPAAQEDRQRRRPTVKGGRRQPKRRNDGPQGQGRKARAKAGGGKRGKTETTVGRRHGRPPAELHRQELRGTPRELGSRMRAGGRG